MHNEDAVATEKLAEGIRKFYADARKLEQYAHTRATPKIASYMPVRGESQTWHCLPLTRNDP